MITRKKNFDKMTGSRVCYFFEKSKMKRIQSDGYSIPCRCIVTDVIERPDIITGRMKTKLILRCFDEFNKGIFAGIIVDTNDPCLFDNWKSMMKEFGNRLDIKRNSARYDIAVNSIKADLNSILVNVQRMIIEHRDLIEYNLDKGIDDLEKYSEKIKNLTETIKNSKDYYDLGERL